MLERRGNHLGSHQATDVSHVCQQVCFDFITHLGRYGGKASAWGGPGEACPRLPSSHTSSPPPGEVPSLQPPTNLSHAGIVNEASIGTGASYDEPRSEKSSSQCQLVIVNEASFGLDRHTNS